jgi:hypothetical protein
VVANRTSVSNRYRATQRKFRQYGQPPLGTSVINRMILVVAVGLCVNACSTTKATLNTHIEPGFNAGSVESLALLPSLNPSFAPRETRALTLRVAQGINDRSPNVRVLGPVEAAQLLNDAGLDDAWATFLITYDPSGVPDKDVLRSVGDALGVDVIVQGEMLNVYQVDGGGAGNSGGKGQTRVTVRFTMLDIRAGRLVWAATSDGIKETAMGGSIGTNAPPIIEAVELAVDKLLLAMPRMGS